jgi:hypothetical protein
VKVSPVMAFVCAEAIGAVPNATAHAAMGRKEPNPRNAIPSS